MTAELKQHELDRFGIDSLEQLRDRLCKAIETNKEDGCTADGHEYVYCDGCPLRADKFKDTLKKLMLKDGVDNL